MKKFIFIVALIFSALPAHLEAQRRDLGRIGGWQIYEEVDVMTDNVLVSAVSIATNVSGGGRVPLLVIACDTYTSPVIMYIFDKFYAGNMYGQVGVEYRIDTQPVTEMMVWGLVTSTNDAAFSDDFVRFIRDARGGNTAIFRVTDPYDGERLTDTFNIARLDEAIRRLPCHN